MEMIFEWTGWSALVRSLLHGLWQGAVVSLALTILLRCLPAARANLRYAVSCGSLLLLVAAWLGTWSLLGSQPGGRASAASAVSESVSRESVAAAPTASGDARGAGSSTAVPAAPPGAAKAAAQSYPWSGYAAAIWLAGVLVFQIRLLVTVAGARALFRNASPPREGPVADAVAAMLDRFQLAGKVTPLEGGGVSVPAVWGWFKPVLLLPPAFFTGMASDQIEAVIAHELAHIRRYDFAVNLIQKVIEGLLFFNPFVWHVSRLIRREREACCDAEAVRVCGRPVLYAKTLASVAGEAKHPALPAPAVAIGKHRGELLERTRRVLRPADCPPFKLSVSGVGGFFLVCLLGLGLLKVTADTAVAMLSPAERLERFAELRREYPLFSSLLAKEEVRDVSVSGIVRVPDGEPVPEGTALNVSMRNAVGSHAYSFSVRRDGSFSFQVKSGDMRIEPRAAGYALTSIGPLRVEEDLADLEITLERGHRGEIHFVDPTGNPIPGVAVRPWSAETGMGMDRREADERGVLVFHQVGNMRLNLDATAPGFQEASRARLRLRENEVVVWELEPAESVPGTVVFADTGEPIDGARIHLASRGAPVSHSHGFPSDGNLLTQTDERGRFELSTLRRDVPYHFTVVAEGAARAVLGPVLAGDDPLHVELPPARYLTVRAVNVTEEDLDRRGRLQLGYTARLEFGRTSHSSTTRLYAEPVDGVAEFQVGPLWLSGGSVTLGDWKHDVDGHGGDLDEEPIVVDLRESKQVEEAETTTISRQVEGILRVPDGLPPPDGAVMVSLVEEGVYQKRFLEPVDGRVRFEVQLTDAKPFQVGLGSEQLIGYWFPRQNLIVTPGETPYVRELALLPAGAVHGRVLEADGQPARGVMIAAVATEPLPDTESAQLGIEVKNNTFDSDTESRFLAGPLPLGGSYHIIAHREFTHAVSEKIHITAEEPFREVVLTLPEGLPMEATLLLPDGAPYTGEGVVLVYLPVPHRSFTREFPQPNRQGRVVVPGLNPAAPGRYELRVMPDRDFQPEIRQITPGRPEVVRLREGKIIEGRLLNAEDGQPLAGVEVFALPVWRSGGGNQHHGWFDAEVETDAEGRFRISNLPEGDFTLVARGFRLMNPTRTITAGAGDSLELRVESR